jgi:hypothetical protein
VGLDLLKEESRVEELTGEPLPLEAEFLIYRTLLPIAESLQTYSTSTKQSQT